MIENEETGSKKAMIKEAMKKILLEGDKEKELIKDGQKALSME